jgi:hypothetical protein
MPGSMPATSQLDLSRSLVALDQNSTIIAVVVRLGIAALHRENAATKLPLLAARPIASIGPPLLTRAKSIFLARARISHNPRMSAGIVSPMCNKVVVPPCAGRKRHARPKTAGAHLYKRSAVREIRPRGWPTARTSCAGNWRGRVSQTVYRLSDDRLTNQVNTDREMRSKSRATCGSVT